MATLIFIDTNIFLDFYRVRGRQGDLSILEHIDSNHNRIITTSQVEMEFKKNRPRVILETFESLKSPKWETRQLPAFLARSKQSSGLETGRKRIDEQLKTLRTRVANVFQKPTRFDSVYKVAQRLFRAHTPYNLSREKEERFKIRRLAWKRFILGYPPRKTGDTSMGDSMNWEWIVRCAQESGGNVVIVSRDSDFGLRFGDDVYINDWLRQEFRERVSASRQLSLTERLTEGLKMASIPVSRAQEESEQKFLEERQGAEELPQVPVFDRLRAALIAPSEAIAEAFMDALRKPARDSERLVGAIEAMGRPQGRVAGRLSPRLKDVEPERERIPRTRESDE